MPFIFLAQQPAPVPSIALLILTILIAFVFAALIVAAALRIVPEYQRIVVFRLGRFVKVMGPGLGFIMPFVDVAARVDLREKVQRYEADTATTQDHQSIIVDWLWSYQVVDAAKCVLNVQNLDTSARELAASILRAIIGSMTDYDAMTGRDYIRTELQTRMSKAIQAWGLEVRQVEIREIKRG